jgi:Uma2 family endonuclease
MLHKREHRRFSVEEYLILEEKAATKNEYCNGEIFSMIGGSLEHNRLVRNLLTELNVALQGKACEVFPSDLRLYVKRHKLFTYPDILVVCGEPRLLAGRKDTITDATFVAEILSPSTQDYDRNEKFEYYRDLPSFLEYLLVAQDKVRLEHHVRQRPGQWLMTEHTSIRDEIALSSIDVSVSIKSIYRGVLDK